MENNQLELMTEIREMKNLLIQLNTDFQVFKQHQTLCNEKFINIDGRLGKIEVLADSAMDKTEYIKIKSEEKKTNIKTIGGIIIAVLTSITSLILIIVQN